MLFFYVSPETEGDLMKLHRFILSACLIAWLLPLPGVSANQSFPMKVAGNEDSETVKLDRQDLQQAEASGNALRIQFAQDKLNADLAQDKAMRAERAKHRRQSRHHNH
jgi:hypothetical protein